VTSGAIPGPSPPSSRPRREPYIDAFRGLMALVMVQGHVFDTLLAPSVVADPLYRFQQIFHGSTAPGFLFASGFVAGLPRAPLSFKASLRRGRRLVFVLGVGYFLNLPSMSLWKLRTQATPAELAAGLACNALHVIAVSQLAVLALQWVFGRRWVGVAGLLAVGFLVASPFVWASGVSREVPLALGAYLDSAAAPSQFPAFPYSAFVLAGTVGGAALGRRDGPTRRRRELVWGGGLMALGFALAIPLSGHVDFWGPSPAYALLRLGGLLLLLRLVEGLTARGGWLTRLLALLGHETLLVYVLHLYLLFGGVIGPAPLGSLVGRLLLPQAFLGLALMLPLLLAAAALWHRVKTKAPHEATLLLVFLGTAALFEFLTRPW
jgi:heparan-alpha-glucosaminide N-acetyltransferase-like protein